MALEEVNKRLKDVEAAESGECPLTDDVKRYQMRLSFVMCTVVAVAALAAIAYLNGASLRYVAWLLHPAKFRAVARLHVASQIPRILFPTVETEEHDDYRRYQNTQQAVIMGQFVLNAALHDSKVSGYRMIREQIDPITWLQSTLKVEFVAGSEVMEISLSGDDPDETAGLVNAVKRAYMDEVVLMETNRRKARQDKLKQIMRDYSEILKERRETLRKLAETIGGNYRPKVTGLKRPELLSLYHGLATKRLDLQLERAAADAGLARRSETAGPVTDPDRQEIVRIEDRIAVLTAQEKIMDERMEHMAGEIRNAESRELAQEELKIEIASMEDMYRKVSAEFEALNVERGAPPRIRVIEDAVPPRIRVIEDAVAPR